MAIGSAYEIGYPSGGWSPLRIVPARSDNAPRQRAIRCAHADLRVRMPFLRPPLRGARLELRHARRVPAVHLRRGREAALDVLGAARPAVRPCLRAPVGGGGGRRVLRRRLPSLSSRSGLDRRPGRGVGGVHEVRARGVALAGGGRRGPDAGGADARRRRAGVSRRPHRAARSSGRPVTCSPSCSPRSGSSGATST